MKNNKPYIEKIIEISEPYLKETFPNKQRLEQFIDTVNFLKEKTNTREVIDTFIDIYIDFVKQDYQNQYKDINIKLVNFLESKDNDVKIIWGDCLEVMKGMKPESIHLIVTSPPYYNAREYSQWKNLNDYLDTMRLIIREAYRVLDNHRVFVCNVGDIFDNDNIHTTSTWGKRRIPLGAYFTKIFEEEGFTFVDDFIWDKGEVQSERHKNGNKPFPFYQYPMNCYEHILIFHKHRKDETRYPCPVCGCLKVNGNAYSEIGLKSWECKNLECFERSNANRGKRFSLKTLITQRRQDETFAIEKGFISEMRLSMRLHDLGWQVHRAYIDESIDFTITKYYCSSCKKYSNQFIRKTNRNGKIVKCVTNLCEHCQKTELRVVSRYLQVKTSEGIKTAKNDVRKFSFHPKIRYNIGKEVFYVWIAVFDDKYEKICHFYVLNTKDVEKFDNINLDTYQITDNQKTELPIRKDGVVLKKGSTSTGYDYSIFNTRFYDDFKALEIELKDN